MKSPKKSNEAPRIAFEQLPFGAVQLHGLQGDQFQATQHFLLDLSTDAMLKPYRELAGEASGSGYNLIRLGSCSMKLPISSRVRSSS
jgi:hypothetical protein